MQVNTFAKQLLALRAQAVATIANIDALLAQLEEEAAGSRGTEKAASDSLPEGESTSAIEVCDHPLHFREPQPTMGHMYQYLCRKCHTLQED